MKNKNNLSKEDIFRFYNFVCDYEVNIKTDYGRFHFDDSKFTAFCKKNGIEPKKKPKNRENALPNSLWFNSYVKKGVNDRAHHLLRHIRNAFAHGFSKNSQRV